MTRIAALAPVLPEYEYTQQQITAELAPLLTADAGRRAVIERLHGSSGIGHRRTALPLEQYRDLGSFRESNNAFIRVGTELLERALSTALVEAGLVASDIDFILFTSVTGIAAPSIDALLVQRMGMRSDVKRVPSFGLGCVAGAAGLARVADYLDGHPDQIGVLLSVELCSLTLQRDDETMGNFVATGLFGDGATAVILTGAERGDTGPRIVDTRSALYPDSLDVIGWNVGGSGFEIVLTGGVANVIERNFATDATAFLSSNDLQVTDITHYVAHPGGPRVLDAFATALDLPEQRLARSWDSLERVGNLSSSSVLHVLADTVDLERPAPGDTGLLFALGPGVSAEFVLLEW